MLSSTSVSPTMSQVTVVSARTKLSPSLQRLSIPPAWMTASPPGVASTSLIRSVRPLPWSSAAKDSVASWKSVPLIEIEHVPSLSQSLLKELVSQALSASAPAPASARAVRGRGIRAMPPDNQTRPARASNGGRLAHQRRGGHETNNPE